MNEGRRTAIVTGSTRGIGLAVAKQLGLDGCNVVIVGTRDGKSNEKTLNWFSARAIPHLYVQADLAQDRDRRKIVDQTLAEFGKIDILVNNAGIAPLKRKDLLDMEEDSFDRLLSVNAKAPLFLTQLVARSMLEQPKEKRNGTMIFITSCSSAVSSINRGEYCISKAAESMVATLFADRLAKENIVVHELRPGIIKTDMTDKVTEKYDRLIEQGVFPIPRWGEPEDVAKAVHALCSDAFRYTTGDHFDIDGGFHIKRL